MKKPLILALLSLLIAGCSFQKETKIIVEKREREPKAEIKEEIKEEDLSSILLVNKEHGLDPSYAPGEDPIAKEALLALLSQMQNEGLNVSDRYSGFRSYEYQSELYADYVMQYGQEEADRFSARPGFSEHQT
ncbi:D-alanyl-D-alanine carboxypeptidase family protein, partial [Dubosiella newyorkensis]